MLKKTIAVLILFTVLLSAFAACGNQMSTSAPTSTPTEAPTVEPTSAPTEAPTEAETDVPTEECTHEWNVVPIEECTYCGERQPLEDDVQVKYHFSGAYRVSYYDARYIGEEVENEDVLDILNQGLWEKEIPAAEYDCKIAVNGKNLWYSSIRGIFANLTDHRHLTLGYEDRLTVNNAFDENTSLFCNAFDSGTVQFFYLTSYGPGSVVVKDEQECSLVGEWIAKAQANSTFEGESTKGHYGCAFGLTVYTKGRAFQFTIYDETRYSVSTHQDSEGYDYFYRADLSEIYNYLNEHYPEEFWYGDRH